MPIQVNNTTFNDVFGNSVGFYRANPGDVHSISLTLSSSIRMSESGNPFTIDPSLYTITTAGVSWLDEGFRVGDDCIFRKHNAGGGVIGAPWYDVISAISPDGFTADFGFIQAAGSIQSGEFLVVYAVENSGSPILRKRDDLDVLINHVNNTIPGGAASIIDGEFTRAVFQNVKTMLVSDVLIADLVGNQSGQFLISSSLERFADNADGWAVHVLILTFAQSGLYNPSYFNGGNCLKLFVKLLWASYAGEPFAPAEYLFNDQANLGWFNEPHNASIANSTLISGVSEIDYSIATTFDIVVDGPLTDLGIGAMYESTDIAYYKNRLYPQQEITMARVTTAITPGVYASYTNEFGAGYTITINSIGTIGTVHTINVTVTPNAAFTLFIADREDGDRLFHLWVKCGNINWLAFSNQLTTSPPVGGPLIMVQDYGYLDHSENVITATGDLTGYISDTEDDIAYIGTFLLTKGDVYQSFNVKIEAYNTVTEEDFTLYSIDFGFSGVQVSGTGVYLLNESIAVNPELPTTSLKRNCLLTLEPSLDTPTEFGVKIYAPWVLNWRYWLPLTTANVDFYPTQNKNWEQYDNLANWIVRTELTLMKDNLAYIHDNAVTIDPYDDEANITGEIEMIVDSSATTVTVIPIGELMRIRVTRTNLTGAWGINTWGQIRIYPNEANPPWIISSVVPFDGNTNNPLSALSGLLMDLQYTTPDVAILECYFDPSLIDLTNGVKISAKIKDPDITVPLPGIIITVNKEAELGLSVRKISDDSIYPPGSPCMSVMRSSDGLSADISFVGFDLDLTALLAHVGTGSGDYGYVDIWYDQSGTGRDAEQIDPAKMPSIVQAGVVNINPDNGLPALLFDGVDDFMYLNSSCPINQVFYESCVFRRASIGINTITLANSTSNPYTVWWKSDNDMYTGANASEHLMAPAQTNIGTFNTTVLRTSLNTVKLYRNGAGVGFSNYAAAPLGLLTVGSSGGGKFTNGSMQELIFYNADKEAQRSYIEASTAAYFL